MRIIDEDMLKLARKSKLRAGRNSMIKHLEGKSITRMQAMNAKCFDCNGMGESNKCDIDSCSLYPIVRTRKGSKNDLNSLQMRFEGQR